MSERGRAGASARQAEVEVKLTVVVLVDLSVVGLSDLGLLVLGNVLLGDGSGGLGADLSRSGLVVALQEGLNSVHDE